MFRILFCMSCCSAPPATRSGKRKSNSNPNLQPKKQGENNGQKSVVQDDSIDKSKLEETKTTFVTLAASEKDQLLANQVQANNENYGTKTDDAQGKLNLAIDSTADGATDKTTASIGVQAGYQTDDSLAAAATAGASTSTRSRRATASYATQTERDEIERYGDFKQDSSSLDDIDEPERSASAGSSTDLGPYTESRQARQLGGQPELGQLAAVRTAEPDEAFQEAEMLEPVVARESERKQLYEPVASTSARNVPSTTKIGDYARLEYSPVEDLDSVTTMSYSRFGSERGAGGRSQAGSTSLSRQNSLGRATGATEESLSRRSSQGGVESTSLSIASQLSNEQFQQNLTNMLESVNSNYPTFGTIGLPLGPPIDSGTFATETTKTSPETPGAALTSASQDSLSDGSFNGELANSPKLSRPSATLRSTQSSTGGALVNDSTQQERANLEEMVELAKPAPLATAEDERVGNATQPIASVVTSGVASFSPTAAADDVKTSGERVGSPQSFTTTTSGGLTNPTPTPSELSGGSGKKKKLKAKALFKKFKPGSKKKNKDEVV